MDTYRLEEGQAIQLTTNSIFYRNVYESEIISVMEDSLEICTPYYKGLHVPLNVGFVLKLKIQTSDSICEFTTEVLDRDVERHSLIVRLPQQKAKAAERDGAAVSACKFIAVTSGKGGVGKTSFIINYAIMLARKGKKVVLMDADLGMANVDVLLGVNSRHTLVDVVEGGKDISEVVTDAPGNIKIIPGGSGIQELASLTTPQFYRITSGFDYLEKNFDYVLIDTGAGLSKNVTNFIYSADETIIITTPEPHAITDAYSIMKVILEKSRDIRLKLIINKCETSREGEAVLDRISGVVRSFLHCNITPYGYILESKVVSRSIKEQLPLAISYPGSDVARSIESMVNCEVDSLAGACKTKTNSNFISKFKSLFGKA